MTSYLGCAICANLGLYCRLPLFFKLCCSNATVQNFALYIFFLTDINNTFIFDYFNLSSFFSAPDKNPRNETQFFFFFFLNLLRLHWWKNNNLILLQDYLSQSGSFFSLTISHLQKKITHQTWFIHSTELVPTKPDADSRARKVPASFLSHLNAVRNAAIKWAQLTHLRVSACAQTCVRLLIKLVLFQSI